MILLICLSVTTTFKQFSKQRRQLDSPEVSGGCRRDYERSYLQRTAAAGLPDQDHGAVPPDRGDEDEDGWIRRRRSGLHGL